MISSGQILFCLLVFAPPLAAATFRDAVRSMGPSNTGVILARELLTVANLMSEHLEYDENSRRFFAFMNDALEDFDFARIYYSPWLTPQPDGFRSISLSGRNTGGAYRVTLGRESSSARNLGSATAEYRMRENRVGSDKTYTTQLVFDAALQKFDAQAAARLGEGMLRVLDPASIAQLNPPASAAFPEIEGEARRIIDLGMAEFPRFTQMLSRYLELRNFAKVLDYKGKKYTEVALRGRFRLNAIATDYPRLKSYLTDLRKLFVLSIYTSDTKGRRISAFSVNMQTEEFFLSFNTLDGKILPIGKDGTPAFDAAFAISGNVDHKFYLGFNFFVNVHGLKIHTGNVGAYVRYQVNAERMVLYTKLTYMPEGKITGALFGVLPTWLIDLSIPSDLQTLMNKFTQTIYKANNGEGSFAQIVWKKHAGQASFYANASTEFLENRFIRIGMKIWVKKFRPNENVQEDIRRFIGALTRALLHDLNAM
jgi:hypothetical protein